MTNRILICLSIGLLGLFQSVFGQVNFEDYPHEYEPIWSESTGFFPIKATLAGTGNSTNGISMTITANDVDVERPVINVTSAGSITIYLGDRLAGYNASDGSNIFDSRERKEGLPSINSESYSEIPNSPFVSIIASNHTSFTLDDEDKRAAQYLVNVLDGKIIANTREAGIKVVFDSYILPRSASILYVGRSGMKSMVALYNLKTGESWVQEKLFRYRAIEHRISGNPIELDNGSFVIPTDNGLFCIDIKTGEPRWRNYIAFIDETSSFGAPPSNSSSFGFGKKKETVEVEENSDEVKPAFVFRNQDKPYVYLVNGLGLMAYDMNTGAEVWKRHRSADPEIDPILVEEGIIVFDKQIYLYDYETGEATWGTNKKFTSDFSKDNNKFKGELAFYEFTPQGIAIGLKKQNAVGNKEYYELNMLDMTTGKLKHEDGFKTDGNLLEMWACGAGVFYITDRAAGVWDGNTGKDAFPPVAATTKNTFFMTGSRQPGFIAPANGKLLTSFKGHMAYIFNTETSLLFKIDTEHGTIEQLTKTPFSFLEESSRMLSNKEVEVTPDFIEVREQGVYISSEQSMALLNFEGETIYKSYYKAPESSVFSKILATAAAVYENYRQQTDMPRPQALPISLLRTSDASAWNKSKALMGNTVQRMEVNMDAAIAVMRGRFEASQQTSDHYFINTQLTNKREDGSNSFGLLKIEKDSGKIVKVFPFGGNRNPQFIIDEITQKLFYLNGGTLNCYQL